jgi:hypothetical protein
VSEKIRKPGEPVGGQVFEFVTTWTPLPHPDTVSELILMTKRTSLRNRFYFSQGWLVESSLLAAGITLDHEILLSCDIDPH